MSHNERTKWERGLGLAAVAVVLAVCLALLASQTSAQQTAPAEWPAWKLETVFLPSGEQGAYAAASPAEQGDWDGWRVTAPCVLSDTTAYRMWYSGRSPTGPGYGFQIGLANSPDGTAWTKSASNPVLGLGAPGTWDDMYRGQVACMVEGGTYKMWYSGASTGPWQTGYATSTDGVTWNVYAGNPVLEVGAPGSWDEQEADGPSVLKDGSTYKMWYFGCDTDYTICSIGYATSPDGVSWAKFGSTPVLTGTVGEWDEGSVMWPRVIKNGSSFEMWYLGNGGIGLATSSDGIAWTKHAGNPVLTESWDGAGVSIPSVLLEGSTYKMWLTGGAGASQGIGYATSSDGIDWTMDPGNPLLAPGSPGLLADVNYDHDWVYLQTLPDATVALTVAGEGGALYTIGGQTDEGGGFGTWQAEWDPEQPNIAPGDVVSATADGLTTFVNPVGSIDAAVDLDADIVQGTVHAPWFAPQTLTVRCEQWIEGAPGINVPGVAADGGSFTCDYGAIGWDLQPGPDVAVRYLEPDGDSVIVVPVPLQPFVTADYGDDWVNGRYEPGHTVDITVKESDGTTLKAAAQVTSREYPEWGGWTGFAAGGEDWLPVQPDIQPGDWVEVLVDTGYTNTVRVGLIDGESNVDTDVVSGTIHAGWLSPYTVTVSCEVHDVENGPSIQVEGVDPDGGSFTCDFSAMWDIQPGHNVAVNYIEPDTDQVQTHFREAAPDLHLEKWPEGSGQAAPGGYLVYTLRYRNEGKAAAGTIVLTDTLPPDTAYVANSSGVEPTPDGDQLVWTLGPLDPDDEERFQLVLSNSAGAEDTLTNQADISTLYDFNMDNNHAEAGVQVVDGQPDLWVGKNRDGDEPTPGETLLYRIDYGNQGPVASGPVVLTDELPEGTTVVGWWSWNGYTLWEEQDRDGQLVLSAPSIPGYWGDQLYVRVLVGADVPLDTELHNQVEIETEGDSDPGNNQSERSDWVRAPRGNVSVHKEFAWGRTVPGGQGEYWLEVRNNGNVATSVVLTETLPAGTSFLHARRWTGTKEVPFPPDYVGGEVAVWDLGLMEPGQWYNLNVRLGYGAGLTPGTVLENCALVAMDGQDTWPFDDEMCAEVPIRTPGPNVSVVKRAQWNWEGRIQYEIRFRNLGTTTVNDVAITDVLPEGTSFSGNWWQNFSEEIQFSQDGDELTWTLSRLEPEWMSEIYFEVDLDGELIGDQGLAFTNVVEAPVPGDIYPADNVHEVVSYTGPDLYARKWLSGGELMPGETVTLTVRFGNQTPGPWRVNEGASVRLTDRLPAGMTYAGAWWPDGYPNDPWFYDPVTGIVVWDFGSLGSDDNRGFYLALDLDEEIALGKHTNRLEISEVPPLDIDPVSGNNAFDYTMQIGRVVYLPLVVKNE